MKIVNFTENAKSVKDSEVLKLIYDFFNSDVEVLETSNMLIVTGCRAYCWKNREDMILQRNGKGNHLIGKRFDINESFWQNPFMTELNVDFLCDLIHDLVPEQDNYPGVRWYEFE